MRSLINKCVAFLGVVAAVAVSIPAAQADGMVESAPAARKKVSRAHTPRRMATRVIERRVIVEKPVTRIIEKQVVVEKPVIQLQTVDRPVLVERVVERPVYAEKCVSSPVMIERNLSAPVFIKEKRDNLIRLETPLIDLGIL